MTNKRCPECQKSGHDTGSDDGHLFLMTDGKRWCCNHTHYHESNTYYFADIGTDGEPVHNRVEGEDKPVSSPPEEPQEETSEEVYADSPFGVTNPSESKCDDLATKGFRGVPDDSYRKYGVKCECSSSTGEPIKFYYPLYTHCGSEVQKIRVVEPEKNFFLSEEIGKRKLKFMGQQLYTNQKELCITEGQDDAIAADYMVNSNRPKNMKVLFVSVPNGANAKAFIDNEEFLEKFDRIVFDPDGDDAGKKLLDKVAELYPKIQVLKKSEKDASDMYSKDKSDEYVRGYNIAKKYVPPSIVNLDDFLGTLAVPNEMGLSYPWGNVTRTTYGMVPHTILSIGSGPGIGKTSVVRAIQQHLMFYHAQRVGIFSLEDPTAQALKYIVGYMMNQRIHLPGAIYDTARALELGKSLRGKAVFFDNKSFEGEWMRIENAIRFMFSEGVCYFFIDPVSALVENLSSSDANTALNAIYGRLKMLIQDLPIYVMCVNHLNNPSTGKKHEDGGRVKPSQFTGSKAAWRASTEMWGAERDTNAEDPTERDIMTLRNLKHRIDGGKMGCTDKLYFNGATGRQEETPHGAPFNSQSLPTTPSGIVTSTTPQVAQVNQSTTLGSVLN